MEGYIKSNYLCDKSSRIIACVMCCSSQRSIFPVVVRDHCWSFGYELRVLWGTDIARDSQDPAEEPHRMLSPPASPGRGNGCLKGCHKWCRKLMLKKQLIVKWLTCIFSSSFLSFILSTQSRSESGQQTDSHLLSQVFMDEPSFSNLWIQRWHPKFKCNTNYAELCRIVLKNNHSS